MIPEGVSIYLGLEPVNMHLSFDRLSGLVEQVMHRDPRGPALYCFCNRRRTHLKAIFADGTGLCIFYKRLDRGRFQLPEPFGDEAVIALSDEPLQELLDGLPVTRAGVHRSSSGLV